MKNFTSSIIWNLFFYSLIVGISSKTEEVKAISIDESKNVSSHDNNLPVVSQRQVLTTTDEPEILLCKDISVDDLVGPSSCQTSELCSELEGDCLDCNFNCSCIYGQTLNVTCNTRSGIQCSGVTTFDRQMVCQYCYQTPAWNHICSGTADCPAISSPRKMYKANCSVKSEIICMGNRNFPKQLPCNWTSGYQWSTALILSITLGGFGADRFYLGHWQEGIGKLFSFGGLGVWTIIDVILIAIRYLGPSNDSLYI